MRRNSERKTQHEKNKSSHIAGATLSTQQKGSWCNGRRDAGGEAGCALIDFSPRALLAYVPKALKSRYSQFYLVTFRRL